MRENTFSDIGDLLNMSSDQARLLTLRIAAMFRNPCRVDSDHALVCAYMNKYRTGGQAAACKEVARRIHLAKEIRILKEMYLDNPDEISYYPEEHD